VGKDRHRFRLRRSLVTVALGTAPDLVKIAVQHFTAADVTFSRPGAAGEPAAKHVP
jgi:hypothetical protein